MKTKIILLYEFNELPKNIQDIAILALSDINVIHHLVEPGL